MSAYEKGRRCETFHSTAATAATETAQMAVQPHYTTFGTMYAQYGPIMTPEDAAGPLRMHPSTVRRLCAEGELPGVKVGKGWRLPTSKLASFLDGEAL